MNKKRSITIKVVLLLAVVCLAGFFTACAKKRTVVFDSCGGTAVETVTVKNKGTVQKPADPTREGYTFEYWTLDGEKFDFSTKITKDITLVAVWKEISVEPVKKVATPTNVVINGNVVSWNAVEGATGYIVYVDGVAKEVTTTSYTLENTDKIEVLICVAAKDAKSVSELSTSVVYRNEIDEAKVQEVIEKFNLPATGYEESVKELAYALAKYNVTPEELLALANGSENPLENIKGNKNAVNEIILDVSHNKVKVLGDQEYELLYKKTAKDRKTLKNWAKNYFINKNYKNIDYTLLSILKQMGDNHEDVDYLNAISGGEILNPDSRLDSTKNSIAQESLENLAKSFKIKYVFDREAGILTDYRAKRLARYAHKIGLAEIEGISEKGFLDVLKEKIAKIRETRLFAKKVEPKALTSGEEKTPKQKIAELLNQDREGIRNRVKVENRNNRIEENAQRMERETQETMKTDVKDIINENNKDNEKTL